MTIKKYRVIGNCNTYSDKKVPQVEGIPAVGEKSLRDKSFCIHIPVFSPADDVNQADG